MQKDILKEIVEKRENDIKNLGGNFGFNLPTERKRKIHPFLQEKGVILEVKRASPSKGDIAPDLDSFKTAKIYSEADAKAISCLTEQNYFKGSLQDLMNVCAAVDEYEFETKKMGPAVLRKDFLTSVQDVEIAYFAGADAILLIARILSKDLILQMAQKAVSLGLSVLIEVRKSEDLEKLALVMQNVPHKNILCGVNSRDLKDFTIDMLIPVKMFAKIKKIAPDARITFESGILSPECASFVSSLGFNAILLGEAAAKNPQNAKKFISAFENEKENKNAKFWHKISNLLEENQRLVKICGITNEKDAIFSAKSGANLLGFIFFNKSKRNVSKDEVLKIKNALCESLKSGQIQKMPLLIGVIVDLKSQEAKDAISLVTENVLDAIQVHTFESSVEFLQNLDFKNLSHYCAINISSKEDFTKIEELNRLGEPRILLDAQTKSEVGGTGKQIEKSLLQEIAKKYKLWIAGGINEQNVVELCSALNPEVLDLSSSLEKSGGIKDLTKIESFFKTIGNKNGIL